MSKLLESIAGIVTRKPVVALALLALVTAGLAAGLSQRLPQAGNEVFLPDDSDIAEASDILEESFPDTAGLSNITILHRGDFLAPEGLEQIDDVIAAAVAEPGVQERLALTNPIVSVAGAFKQALGVQDLSGITQQQIEAVASEPQIAAMLRNLSGEAGGESLVISTIKLRSLGDSEATEDIELLVADAVETVDGPLSVRSMSAATRNLDSAEASPSMGDLMMGALVVIAVLLFLFFRSGSDVALSLVGLAITIVGTLGFEGLVGPDGLGLIGSPNSLTSMVPIMMVGLVVDYSIQTVAKYRELRGDGLTVADATRRAFQGVALPLGLAAGTTIISFLTNLTSPIPANGDFGVVAAFGVFFGLFTMLILIPAARSLFDRRREAAGKLGDSKQMTDAIPGAGKFVEAIGRLVAAKPMVVLAAAGALTIGLGAAATQISTEFNSNDFLPTGSDSIEDIEAINEALGGETVLTTTLIEAELTDDRTLRNLLTLSESFGDELSRPSGVDGDLTLSLGVLFNDWFNDSGQPGDNYDPELVELAQGIDQGLTVDAQGVQALLDRLEEVDPIGFAQVAVNNPDGDDLTLVQFNAFAGDQDLTTQMVEDIDGLWFGDRDQITASSSDITALEVTGAMTDGQTTSIAITLLAALIVLMIFFGVTEFKPMLGFIAVSPILVVLLWVLGSMTILGIPYNVVTALITALSIGIGVDYTIHIIHRFTEELEHGKSLIDATTTTLSTTGSALIGSALTTALAFAVLLLSPQLPFQQFGLVTGITILYALIASIVIVPPMLIVWAAYHQWRAGMEQ